MPEISYGLKTNKQAIAKQNNNNNKIPDFNWYDIICKTKADLHHKDNAAKEQLIQRFCKTSTQEGFPDSPR